LILSPPKLVLVGFDGAVVSEGASVGFDGAVVSAVAETDWFSLFSNGWENKPSSRNSHVIVLLLV